MLQRHKASAPNEEADEAIPEEWGKVLLALITSSDLSRKGRKDDTLNRNRRNLSSKDLTSFPPK